MAYLSGKKMILQVGAEGEEDAIVCEESSSISFNAEAVEIRCKGTGAFAAQLPEPDMSGSISFAGVYDSSSDNSAFDLAELLVAGEIINYIWGGQEAGEPIISGEALLVDIEISAETGDAVRFTGTANLSGDPTFGVVPT